MIFFGNFLSFYCIKRFFNNLARKVGDYVLKVTGNVKQDKYKVYFTKLNPDSFLALNPEVFIGYKVIASIVTSLIPMFLIKNLFILFQLIIITGVAGFFLPDFILKRLITKREKVIDKDFSYILDLLYITTLSGQNIYNSLCILSTISNINVTNELKWLIRTFDFGINKQDAYKNFLLKTSSEKLGNLLFLLIQAEKYGSPISNILKQKSKFVRFEVLQEFEAKAKRSSIILLLPLVFLILPAFILLVGGPIVFSIASDYLTL